MLLSEFFVLLLFGAPAGILSSLLAVLGVWKKRIIALIVAGLWSIPATYYLSAGLGLPLFITALFVFGAAYAVHKNKIRIAWLLLIPLFLCAIWMTVLTIYGIFYS
jgi:hypothetical protein